MLTGAIIGLIVGICFIIYANRRSSTHLLSTKPPTLHHFPVPMPSHTVLQHLHAFAQQNGYKVDTVAEPNCIILNEGASWKSYGFFFPIYLSSLPDGGTMIEVGLESKIGKNAKMLRRRHEQFLAQLGPVFHGVQSSAGYVPHL